MDATGLSFPVPDAETSIATDTSNAGVNAVLQQSVDGCCKPLAFFSKKNKKHNPGEERYNAYDRELLAIYKAIKRFLYFIEGRRFHIFADHKPLVTMFVNNKQSYTRRQLRHMDYIRQFTTDIRHVKGTDNTPADALSCNISAATSPTTDYATIAADQVPDAEWQRLKDNPSLVMKVILPDSGISLYPDVSRLCAYLCPSAT